VIPIRYVDARLKSELVFNLLKFFNLLKENKSICLAF